MSNVRGLPPSDPTDLDKVLAQIEKEEVNQPKLVRVAEYLARIDFRNMQAYIKAGFTPVQAFELLRASKMEVKA